MAKKETQPIVHKLRFPVDKVSDDKDLLQEFPELAAYPEFSAFEGDDRDKWIRYVMYYIDGGSGFMKIGDIEKRQKAALKEAGIPASNFDCIFALSGTHKGINAMITAFFRILNNFDLERYISGQMLFQQQMEVLRSPVTGLEDDKLVTTLANKNRVFNESRQVGKDLKELEKELFAGDAELKTMVTELVNTKNQGWVESMIPQ